MGVKISKRYSFYSFLFATKLLLQTHGDGPHKMFFWNFEI